MANTTTRARRNCGVYGLHKLFATAADLANFNISSPHSSYVNEYTVVYVVCDDDDAAIFGSKYCANSKWIIANKQIFGSGDFSPIIDVTYSELVSLKSGSGLIPGLQYRITDYATVVSSSSSAVSANHPFDVIVTADSVNKLSEIARASNRAEDTYFANSKLGSWELKYCLDNDTTRFDWADATNGKGVIYYMKDEFGNELPYDFKNVMFKEYNGSAIAYGLYTFSSANASTCTDKSMVKTICDNKIDRCVDESGCQSLNYSVFIGDNVHTNTIGVGSKHNTFGGETKYGVIGNFCTGLKCGTSIKNFNIGNCVSDVDLSSVSYIENLKIDNGVKYSNLTLQSGGTTTSTSPLRNVNIHGGFCGTQSSKINIEIPTEHIGVTYSIDLYKSESVVLTI